MPNSNYKAGARLEYARRKHWIKKGFEVVRSAGSHGSWDLCAVDRFEPLTPVLLIQCKRVETAQLAKALVARFVKNPPLPKSTHYNMVLEVSVKGSRDIISVTI